MKQFKYYLLSFILLFDFYVSTFISSKFLNLFIVLAILVFYTKGVKKELPKILILLSILTIASLVNNSLDINNFFSEYIKLISVILLYFTLENNPTFMLRFLRTIFKVTLWSCIFLLITHFLLRSENATSIFQLNNIYLRFNVSIPVLLLPILISRIKILNIDRFIFILGIVSIVIVTLLADWRAMQLGLIFIMLYYYFFTFKFIKAKIIISGFIVVSLLYFNKGDIKIFNSISNPSSKTDISSGRFYLWAKSLNTFEKSENKYKIFGYGFGQYPQAINLFGFNAISFRMLNSDFESFNEKDKNSRIHAHNPFFNMLIENGIIGVFIYVFMYVIIIKRIKKNQKKNYKDYYLTLFVMFLSGMFTSVSYLNSPLIWVLLFLSKNQINYDYRSVWNSRSREVISD